MGLHGRKTCYLFGYLIIVNVMFDVINYNFNISVEIELLTVTFPYHVLQNSICLNIRV